MLTLRPYQEAAKAAVYEHLRTRDDNPCVVIPTAGGKTPVMAAICKDAVTLWRGRVLILAHVRELLEQTADKLRRVCPEVEFGIYSAGLNRRDTDCPVILAGIQSVYQRACELGAFDLVLVDEAHMIPPDGDGMYRTFLKDAKVINPNLRIVGFTATPFRLQTGLICTPDGLLNHICYEISVRELIVQGYLCPLITKSGLAKADFGQLHVRGGEFVASETEELMDDDQLVEAACAEIVTYTSDRNAVLIFTSGIRHGEHVVQVLRKKHGIECGFVTGDTPAAQRDELLLRFRGASEDGTLCDHKPLKYLCNVNVLTTGFDAPNIDCVVLLRPTMSPGLYYQMVGRGFRLHPGKQNCLVLDFGGNALRHGPVDKLQVKERSTGNGEAPVKECPECHSVIAAGYGRCPDCGYQFPPPERSKHDAKASNADILSNQSTTTQYTVWDVCYSVHVKRGADISAPKSMRVDYKIGWNRWKSEWICFEHTGYPRKKAIAWWRQRSLEPVPKTAAEAVAIARNGGLASTHEITVRSTPGDYDRIIDYVLGPVPEPVGGQVTVEEQLPDDALDFPFGANVAKEDDEIPW